MTDEAARQYKWGWDDAIDQMIEAISQMHWTSSKNDVIDVIKRTTREG